MTRGHLAIGALLVAALAAGAGCADKLPDQDLRILTTAPSAKISTDILWTDYQSDKKAANRKYGGEVVEITGPITSLLEDPPRVMFVQMGQKDGVSARLLDERASRTMAALKVGDRVTLRCFCESLEGSVILKSCIKP